MRTARVLAFVATATALEAVAGGAAAAEPSLDASAEPPPAVRAIPPPVDRYTFAEPQPYPSLGWVATQLLPSPELAVGKDAAGETKTAFGLRWQLTPALWSWGVHRRLSGWRFFVVDPLARMSGSIALETHFEYIGGHVDRPLARPAVKATFPLLHRGEYLAFSIGTSVYRYDDRVRVAHDVGIYALFGTVGLVATVAPEHSALTTIATLRLRYF